MTQHQFPGTRTLRQAAQDALSTLEAIQPPNPDLITRKRGISRQEHEDEVSTAIEKVEMHMLVIENLRAALAEPEQPAIKVRFADNFIVEWSSPIDDGTYFLVPVVTTPTEGGQSCYY